MNVIARHCTLSSLTDCGDQGEGPGDCKKADIAAVFKKDKNQERIKAAFRDMEVTMT